MIYESDENREKQSRCAWVLEHMGFEVKESSTLAHWDFAIRVNGQPYALAEHKGREDRQYDPYYIDVGKVDPLIDEAAKHGVQPALIVEWPDIGGYWWWNAHKGCATREFTRTKPRGVAGETPDRPDLVYMIPISEFRQL